MAVTVAVEEVIGEHYNSQLRDMIENGYTKEEQDLRLKNVCVHDRILRNNGEYRYLETLEMKN